MLSFILGASAASWITSRLTMIGIVAAVLAATNGATGIYFYMKGYNSAANACRISEIARQLDEARRDLKVAADTGAKLKNELAERDKRLADADRRTAEYAAQLQRQQEALDETERKLAQNRPKSCPACPPARRCVVD